LFWASFHSSSHPSMLSFLLYYDLVSFFLSQVKKYETMFKWCLLISRFVLFLQILFTHFIIRLFFFAFHEILCALIVWSFNWRVQFWFFFSFAEFDFDSLFHFKVWTCLLLYLLFYFVYCFFFI
jgi:hypothetical protein